MGQLLFKKCFWEAIRDGSKRTTIRRWDRPRVSVGKRAYSLGLGWLLIEAVDVIDDPARVTLRDARADGFKSVAALVSALEEMYPGAPSDGKRWYLIRFRREDLLSKNPPVKPRARRARRVGR